MRRSDAYFHGTLEGRGGRTSRRGTKDSGLLARLSTLQHSVAIRLDYDEATDRVHLSVFLHVLGHKPGSCRVLLSKMLK